MVRYLVDGDSADAASPALRYAPICEIRAFLRERRPPASVAEISDCDGFTIITPFHKHLDLFKETAASVDRFAGGKKVAECALEWVIVNDDSAISDKEVTMQIPKRLLPIVRYFRPNGGGGIVNALNTGIRHSRHRWLLFLDCDDEIEPNAIAALIHYIELFPRCRYISSSMIDIGESGDVLRFRGNEHPIDQLLDTGMLAGHLKAIRRDLFEEIGFYSPRFELCQDYEFALRTSMREPILKIPEPLYRYRWHERTQSVSRSSYQNTIRDRVQQEYVRRFLDTQHGARLSAVKPAPQRSPCPTTLRGAAIVRTQNSRTELLLEAVASVRAQEIMTPIVVVHGGKCDFRDVETMLSDDGGTVFLHASEERKPGRHLGYPANVAFDYVTEETDKFNFITFLDDDDILYPFFGARMSEALTWSGADLVYSMSNKRVP